MRADMLEKFATRFAELLGSSWAFLVALLIVMSWAVLIDSREAFNNPRIFVMELTGMFIFLHLFMIQRSHNKHAKALHLKLDELIASKDGANNSLIKAERAPEVVIDELHHAYEDLAESSGDSTEPIAMKKQSKEQRRRSA